MRFLYRIDSPDNLFPSIHCMLGWICWIAVRGKKDISIGIRALSFLLAVAVCCSTLMVRQHVILDVAGGILLSEISYRFADNVALSSLYTKLFNWFIEQSSSLQKAADMRKALKSGSWCLNILPVGIKGKRQDPGILSALREQFFLLTWRLSKHFGKEGSGFCLHGSDAFMTEKIDLPFLRLIR